MNVMKKLLSLSLAFLMIAACVFPVWAADEEIVEEQWTPVENNIMDSYGYLYLIADPPTGFEGVFCVELYSHIHGKQTLTLSAAERYAGGDYLLEGTYTVTSAYVLNNEHLEVTVSTDRVVISHEEDAWLYLETVDMEETTEATEEATEATEAPTEEVEEAAEPEVTEAPTEVTEAETQSEQPQPTTEASRLPIGSVIAILVLIFFGLILIRRQIQRIKGD